MPLDLHTSRMAGEMANWMKAAALVLSGAARGNARRHVHVHAQLGGQFADQPGIAGFACWRDCADHGSGPGPSPRHRLRRASAPARHRLSPARHARRRSRGASAAGRSCPPACCREPDRNRARWRRSSSPRSAWAQSVMSGRGRIRLLEQPDLRPAQRGEVADRRPTGSWCPSGPWAASPHRRPGLGADVVHDGAHAVDLDGHLARRSVFSKAAATSVRPELEITPGLMTRISAA